MFGLIKRWMERRRRKAILKDIKEAKYIYLIGKEHCMCHCFMFININRYGRCEKIREIIPEFKPETFNIPPANIDGLWWNIYDHDSRIKAFDKLIEIYSK